MYVRCLVGLPEESHNFLIELVGRLEQQRESVNRFK